MFREMVAPQIINGKLATKVKYVLLVTEYCIIITFANDINSWPSPKEGIAAINLKNWMWSILGKLKEFIWDLMP